MGKKDKKHDDKDILIPEKAELVSPFEEMERWFGDFMNRPFFFPDVGATVSFSANAVTFSFR